MVVLSQSWRDNDDGFCMVTSFVALTAPVRGDGLCALASGGRINRRPLPLQSPHGDKVSRTKVHDWIRRSESSFSQGQGGSFTLLQHFYMFYRLPRVLSTQFEKSVGFDVDENTNSRSTKSSTINLGDRRKGSPGVSLPPMARGDGICYQVCWLL